MITLSRQQEMKDRFIAFLFGDGFVTLYLWFAGIINDLGKFGLGVIGTVIIGFAGGIAGMAGKDVYPYVKKFYKRCKNWIKNKFKTKPKLTTDE